MQKTIVRSVSAILALFPASLLNGFRLDENGGIWRSHVFDQWVDEWVAETKKTNTQDEIHLYFICLPRKTQELLEGHRLSYLQSVFEKAGVQAETLFVNYTDDAGCLFSWITTATRAMGLPGTENALDSQRTRWRNILTDIWIYAPPSDLNLLKQTLSEQYASRPGSDKIALHYEKSILDDIDTPVSFSVGEDRMISMSEAVSRVLPLEEKQKLLGGSFGAFPPLST